MPYINVTLFPGQTRTKKKVIAEKITDVIRNELGVPDQNIWVTYTEVPKAEWSIGGKMCGPIEEPSDN